MTDDLLTLVNFEDILLSDCKYLKLDDSIECCRTNTFVVSHLNIHSLPDKFHDLQIMLDMLNEKNLLPDIVCLCETFLTENNYSKFHFEGFDLISQYRKNKQRGGVSIMVKSYISYIERTDLAVFEEGKFESIFIEISRKGKCNVVVGEIYRVPGTNEKDFIETYEKLIEKIRLEKKKIIIGTDQNLDYLKINIHNNTMKFFELNVNNSIIPTIYKPTRVTQNTATLIDNIYIDGELYNDIQSYIIIHDISDHFMCMSIVKEDFGKTNGKKTIQVRKITDSVLRNMTASLRNRDWNVLENMSVNEVVNS